LNSSAFSLYPTCPVCDKPVFYAPRAPEDTAKQACSDLNCVNAHGIIHFSPIDNWEAVEIDFPHHDEKEKNNNV
jgi:hypothetical protein